MTVSGFETRRFLRSGRRGRASLDGTPDTSGSLGRSRACRSLPDGDDAGVVEVGGAFSAGVVVVGVSALVVAVGSVLVAVVVVAAVVGALVGAVSVSAVVVGSLVVGGSSARAAVAAPLPKRITATSAGTNFLVTITDGLLACQRSTGAPTRTPARSTGSSVARRGAAWVGLRLPGRKVGVSARPSRMGVAALAHAGGQSPT